MEKQDALFAVAKAFKIQAVSAEPYGDGHINGTFLIGDKSGKKYVLQKINTAVFRDPAALMKNERAVTLFYAEKIRKEGGDPARETLTVLQAKDGSPVYAANGETWRASPFIENTVYYSVAPSDETFGEAGRAFGKFARILSDFPARTLTETIKNFHDTPSRVRAFEDAVKKDALGRAETAKEEIAFFTSRKGIADKVTKGIASGEIPVKVTHNDTKINNVLFDKDTGKAVAVIDLDTVMPGSILYDFGDAIRSGTNMAAEDERNLEKVKFSLSAYAAFTRRYLAEIGESVTEKEKELLATSALLMTYECGVRFLTDYLLGDVYFKTQYPEHNLVRARTQMKLLSEMEKALIDMEEAVRRAQAEEK